MQESKEIGPHITKKEELDALYRRKETETMEEDNRKNLSDNQEEY